MVLKQFHKLEMEGTLPNLFCNITLKEKPDKNTMIKENDRSVALGNTFQKSLIKYLQTRFSNTLRGPDNMTKKVSF
jgi:hypothetical protein